MFGYTCLVMSVHDGRICLVMNVYDEWIYMFGYVFLYRI